MTIEKELEKVSTGAKFIMLVVSFVIMIAGWGVTYANFKYTLEENTKSITSLQQADKEILTTIKEDESDIARLDKEGAKIDAKLTNIEATLIEIKQSLKGR